MWRKKAYCACWVHQWHSQAAARSSWIMSSHKRVFFSHMQSSETVPCLGLHGVVCIKTLLRTAAILVLWAAIQSVPMRDMRDVRDGLMLMCAASHRMSQGAMCVWQEGNMKWRADDEGILGWNPAFEWRKTKMVNTICDYMLTTKEMSTKVCCNHYL